MNVHIFLWGDFLIFFLQNSIFPPVEFELFILDLCNSYSTFFIPGPLAHPPPSWIENVNKLSVADTGSGINIRIIGLETFKLRLNWNLKKRIIHADRYYNTRQHNWQKWPMVRGPYSG